MKYDKITARTHAGVTTMCYYTNKSKLVKAKTFHPHIGAIEVYIPSDTLASMQLYDMTRIQHPSLHPNVLYTNRSQ